MEGRATDIEEELTRREDRKTIEMPRETEKLNRELGELTTSNMPEELSTGTSPIKENEKNSTPITVTEARALETRYSALFEYGVFELLTHLDSEGPVKAEPYQEELPDLTDIAESQSLVEVDELLEPSTQGQQVLQNWNRFKEALAEEERYNQTVSRKTEKDMPDFINNTIDTEIDLDRYLRNPESFKNRWLHEYSPEDEFREVVSVLYDENLTGQSIRDLYRLEQPERPSNIDNKNYEVGLNGLVDGEELNYEGKRLLRSVRMDQLYLD